MAYHKYTTEAFVIEARSQGESNKTFLLFTEGLGMIRASAQSVRELKSKLRFSLEEYSLSEVCVVRGKSSWKITSAACVAPFFHTFGDTRKVAIAAHTCALLRRLLHGEEKNQELFLLLSRSFTYLATKELDDEALKNFECILVLGILHLLGYVGANDAFQSFLGDMLWSDELLSRMQLVRGEVLTTINSSLQATQM
jgi:DNA repair protein RecO